MATSANDAAGNDLPAQIRSGADYIDSLRGRSLKVYLFGELIDELNEQLLPQLQQREARLYVSGQQAAVELQGNKDALLGALANLCMNALQACEREPRIEIAIGMTQHGLLSISLRNNGSGMDRDTRAHIFDPFFSTKTDGTGLGLAVVKAVIESHQGRIAVYSRPGRGCRFRIFLPCRQAMKAQISNTRDNGESLPGQDDLCRASLDRQERS